MAMTGAGMGSAINDAVAAIPGITISNAAEAAAYHNALGKAIVAYIQANAVVNTADMGEVTSGLGAGGSVVATGVGTVS